MKKFNAGDKVRVNEGLLEGQTGTVVTSGTHVTAVMLEDVAFGSNSITFYTETLVPASEEHEALKALKLYPDLLKGDYQFRVTTFVDGIMYVSLPLSGNLVKSVLKSPPAGLEEIEYAESGKVRDGEWKLLWEA